MATVKINRTQYNIISETADGEYVTLEIKKGTTVKSLIGRTRPQGTEWTLWSGRVGLPKQVTPLFMDDLTRRIEQLRKRSDVLFSAQRWAEDLEVRYQILDLEAQAR